MSRMKDKILRDPKYVSIIRIIHKERKIRPVQLARIFNVSRQAIDYRLNILLATGYLEKEYSDGKVYYKLSELGTAIIEKDKKPKFDIFSKHQIHWEERHGIGYLIFYIHIIVFISAVLIGSIGFVYFYIFTGDTLRGGFAFVIWLSIGSFLYYIIKQRLFRRGIL